MSVQTAKRPIALTLDYTQKTFNSENLIRFRNTSFLSFPSFSNVQSEELALNQQGNSMSHQLCPVAFSYDPSVFEFSPSVLHKRSTKSRNI